MTEKSEPHLVEVVILRDFWTESTRHVAGTIVKVPVEAALEGIESGALGRVKKPNAG